MALNGNGKGNADIRVGREQIKEGERRGAVAIIRYLAPKILLALCAYFVAQAALPFGARPFGVALLASASAGALPIYIGLSVASFVGLELFEGLVYFGIYTALLLARALVNFTRSLKRSGAEGRAFGTEYLRRLVSLAFDDGMGERIALSAIFGLALGSAVLFSGGMLYYDLFALLIVTALAPALCALLYGFFEYGKDSASKEVGARGAWSDVGFLALACISVLGARELTLYGVSIAVFGALLSIFYVSYSRGVGYGAILGLALGLCYSPMLAPMFVIAAICAGIFMRLSPALACFSAFAASSAWAFYVEGLSALLGVFGGILAGCLVYSVAHKIIFVDIISADSKGRVSEEKKESAGARSKVLCRVLPDGALDGVRLYEMNLRMSAISDGLRKLSAFFDEVKKRNGFCNSKDTFCAEKYNFSYSTFDETPDYGTLSALLTKAMERGENDYKTDIELSKRVCSLMNELNLDIFGALVYGVRKKTIYLKGKSKEKIEDGVKSVLEALALALPFEIDSEGYEIRREGDSEECSLLVFEREKISASVVRRRVNAKNESVCGDSIAVFKNKDDRFFAMLSDGMGSGEVASAVAQISTGFLYNMLSVGGVSVELISMLNGFLCGRRIGGELECSATLDLLELDLMSGSADIYKCGAAPSYIFRRGRLFKVRSKTMPIGILGEVDVKRFSLELCRGDIVVMVSDGVTGEGGECPWLFDLLAQNLPCRTLERTAELIIKYSSAKGSVDDISVLLIEIK